MLQNEPFDTGGTCSCNVTEIVQKLPEMLKDAMRGLPGPIGEKGMPGPQGLGLQGLKGDKGDRGDIG
jgi:hypothetical protein